MTYRADGGPQGRIDLGGAQILRTTFASSDASVNFNVGLYDWDNGHAHLGDQPGGAGAVDLPLAEFQAQGPFDPDRIRAIVLLFQTGTVRAGNDYVISSFEAI